MAIIKSAVKLILRELPVYRYSGPALCLGVPEIYATQRELARWFPALAGKPFPLEKSAIHTSNNYLGKQLRWVTAGTFLHSLGITDVSSLDVPGCEHTPDLIHDLNNPLPASHVNRFNLIVDPGTLEHVFNIKTGFASIVQALKVGGVIIQQLPVYSYNGGYYSINPNVLFDFYAANGFTKMKAFIIMWDRYRAYTGPHRCYEYCEELLGSRHRHGLADYDQCRFSPHMLFLAQKEKALPQIQTPLQFEGQYLEADGNPAAPKLSLVRRAKRGVFSMLHACLPHAVVYYGEAMIARNRQWFRTRRRSFWI